MKKVIGALFVVGFLLAGTASAQTGNYYNPRGMMSYDFNSGGGMMGGYNGGYYWFGWVTMILVWALLILGIIALVRWLKKNK